MSSADGEAARGGAEHRAYREALAGYPAERLRAVVEALGPWERRPTARGAPGAIAERLDAPDVVEGLLAGLEPASLSTLGLIGLAGTAPWRLSALAGALRATGIDPAAAGPLVELGLVAPAPGVAGTAPIDPIALLERAADDPAAWLVPHSAAVGRIPAPTVPRGAPAAAGPVRQVREADRLEAVLRLSALWQRAAEAPLRWTLDRTLYKRDRQRLEDDPAIAGPIADELRPLDEPLEVWFGLAHGLGLLRDEEGSERIVAAGADFWAEHAVHLPQMAAQQWLALDAQGDRAAPEGARAARRLGPLRLAGLLRLAALEGGEWAALDDLAAAIAAGARPEAEAAGPGRGDRLAEELRARLEATLLGPAYALGLVRAAEEDPSGRRVVQLTDFGRYVLGMGPAPAPREAFPHFLTVQPNFEIIAYRQGLNPYLIGQLGRFARWRRLGAAVELALTPESTYRALEGGMTPEAILERLTRHSARPLPAGVADALRTWAGRRERVMLHASATIVEFAAQADRDAALAHWPDGGGPAPLAVGERLLLVEDTAAIPFQRLRLLGSRDYRQPPEVCVEVGPDGVSLALDPNRSDLFVAAELGRFADEAAGEGGLRRPFRITGTSLRRWTAAGLGEGELGRWFHARTGSGLPPAVALLLASGEPGRGAPELVREWVIRVPQADWLDGLEQHPETAGLLGERLGPTAAIVAEGRRDELLRRLEALGFAAGRAGLPDGSSGREAT